MGRFSIPSFMKSSGSPIAMHARANNASELVSPKEKGQKDGTSGTGEPQRLFALWDVELKRARRPGWTRPEGVPDDDENAHCPGCALLRPAPHVSAPPVCRVAASAPLPRRPPLTTGAARAQLARRGLHEPRGRILLRDRRRAGEPRRGQDQDRRCHHLHCGLRAPRPHAGADAVRAAAAPPPRRAGAATDGAARRRSAVLQGPPGSKIKVQCGVELVRTLVAGQVARAPAHRHPPNLVPAPPTERPLCPTSLAPKEVD